MDENLDQASGQQPDLRDALEEIAVRVELMQSK
jgi:hypothetical protein